MSAISDFTGSFLGPIRDRPLRSLVFFALIITVGLFIQTRITTWPSALQVSLLTVFIGTPATGIVLSVHRLVVARDEPSRLKT